MLIDLGRKPSDAMLDLLITWLKRPLLLEEEIIFYIFQIYISPLQETRIVFS